MKHIFETTVYYADTDSYGVVWHGSYLRWMEQARVEFCRSLGLSLINLKKENIVLPVTSISIKYKSSAKLDDNIIIETNVYKMTPTVLTMQQIIKNKNTGNVYVFAMVDIVAIDNTGKLYRKIPDVLKIPFMNILEEKDSAYAKT